MGYLKRVKIIKFSFFLILLLSCSALSVEAANVTLDPIADGYIMPSGWNYYPTWYGNYQNLNVSNFGSDPDDTYAITYLQFPLASIPDNAAIDSVTLGLYKYSGESISPINVNYFANDAWDENGYPTGEKGILLATFTPADSSHGWFTWNLTGWDPAADLLDDKLSLVVSTDVEWTALSFYSTDSFSWDTPYLSVEYSISSVPVPGAAWLLFSGLIGLLGFRKRGRAA